jgi:hypothetical protein
VQISRGRRQLNGERLIKSKECARSTIELTAIDLWPTFRRPRDYRSFLLARRSPWGWWCALQQFRSLARARININGGCSRAANRQSSPWRLQSRIIASWLLERAVQKVATPKATFECENRVFAMNLHSTANKFSMNMYAIFLVASYNFIR